MESAYSAPAPPHAPAEMNAASAACGRANAPRAVASHPAVTKVAPTGCTPADATDDETAAASEGAANANPRDRSNASDERSDAAEDDGAASDEDIFGGRSADEDVEEVKDPRGIIGSSAGRYNEALLQRAGSPTRAEPGWAGRPPPDGIARVAGAIILCQRQHVDDSDHDASPPQDDPDWAEQSTLEMMAELEELEEHIERPNTMNNQR